MTNFEFLRKRLHERAGLIERPKPKDLRDLYCTQWSPFFERAMRNRLVMGALRYGEIPQKAKYNYIKSLENRLAQYKETGNTELLVDVANLAMLEFVCGSHPNKHWHDVHDDHCGVPL